MASSKDTAVQRPVSGSFSRTNSSQRPHSNSLSANNSGNKVNRRKSVNAAASTIAQAAIAAHLRENGEASPLVQVHRKSVGSRRPEAQSMKTTPSMHTYFSGTAEIPSTESEMFEDMSMDEDEASTEFNKQKSRRASEGSHLIKSSKKGDLRCDTCGKGYKHSSCLTKHMWEHNPAWAVTSKLLISKHQQVQMLEAATVLMGITVDKTSHEADFDAVQIDYSDGSAGSPQYSGSDEAREATSAETTPPPMSDDAYPIPAKNEPLHMHGISQSYRSVPAFSYTESAFSPRLFASAASATDFRPRTAGTEDGNLADAAAGLSFTALSNHKTSKDEDIPPVPPLPQRFQSYSKSTPLDDLFSLRPASLTQQVSDERERSYSRGESKNRRGSSPYSGPRNEDFEGMFRMDQ